LSADITVRLAPLRGVDDPIGAGPLPAGRERVSARDDLSVDPAVDAGRFRDDPVLERAD